MSDPNLRLLSAVVADSLDTSGADVERLLKTLGDNSAFTLAEENEVVPHVAHAAQRCGVAVDAAWTRAHTETEARLSEYMDVLDLVAATLDSVGIELVALKNAGIARGIYPCLGCSPMGDLDVLIRPRHFRRAHDILIGMGFNFEFRSELDTADLVEAELGGGTEYWRLLPDGTKLWFELQWRPVAGRWIQPHQEPRADDLVDRSTPIPGTAVRLLMPVDNLLQVCLHTAKHTYVRAPGYRLHTDVDRIVRRQEIDWDRFVKEVSALRVRTAVFFSLDIPVRIFGTPVPDTVLADLAPNVIKRVVLARWINVAGLLNPRERKFGRIGYLIFNVLLYDDIRALMRAIFPSAVEMRVRYGKRTGLSLLYFHLRRVCNLILSRAKT